MQSANREPNPSNVAAISGQPGVIIAALSIVTGSVVDQTAWRGAASPWCSAVSAA
jgi:hypothetical protein